jgi:hypothetical protein
LSSIDEEVSPRGTPRGDTSCLSPKLKAASQEK